MTLLKSGWVVERNHIHQGVGTCLGKLRWVGFNDDRLLVFDTKDEAITFMRDNKLEDRAFVCEHGWYDFPK